MHQRKSGIRIWTGFSWLRKMPGDRFLWTFKFRRQLAQILRKDWSMPFAVSCRMTHCNPLNTKCSFQSSPLCPSGNRNMQMVMIMERVIFTGKNRRRETSRGATFSTTNLTWTGLGSNLFFRCKRPATDITALRTRVSLGYFYGPSPYRAVNTLRLGCTNQPVNAV